MAATLLSSTHVAPTHRVRVERVRDEAMGIRSFQFVPVDGVPLSGWKPGAHVDVHLPSGTIRQYSLCGDLTDRESYRIAVLEIVDGRGGSVEVHRELTEGAVLEIGVPRNDFRLQDAPAYLFIAGGIGITPILAMIKEVAAAGKPWRLVYGARSAANFAFTEEIDALAATTWGRVDYVPQDTAGHADLPTLVKNSVGHGVYCCGPGPLMDALGAEMTKQARGSDLVIERFTPPEIVVADGAGSFEVELTESGVTVTVEPDVSILEAIRDAGVDVPSSCEMGICGTCETRVISGDIEHNDSLLTDDERDAGDVMMICVSRACSPKLVLAR
ncbi:oxidoreductase [Leucobacter sp. cx-42]|uniref:PDR/VanB family oxidoreductase n=1 Tax=unclassified Leucobacter TaxID=2621730 RepID=UPI00165D841D|nr:MULTISPECIES: PDR/VanB family oxidoreductase [unclassified Leucobacter]MBC9953197.1 oxidoreductase [Leucobacter sp. cx-42]